MPSVDSGFTTGVLSFLFLALCATLALYQQTPPAAVAANAPATDFSSGRAMEHLQAISRQPHPIGSLEQAAVRDHILQELVKQGLNPEVQQTSVVYSTGHDALRGGTVENVVARLGGTSNDRAVLLVAHYDTVSNSPGASDNGSSVVTLLETARALKAGPPLHNDVILLFTDGEESGLLGARAFVEKHPWAEDVGVALNFEARGDSGPTLMFETSEGNGGLIKEFARAVSYPRANSLAFDIYRLLPNDTDLTVFKAASLPGLNFAYVDGATSYHARIDNLENLDERSLQHKGSSALALTRHFGDLKLTGIKEGNAVYFDILGKTLVHYPATWVMPLTVLMILLFAGVVAVGLKRNRLTFGGMAVGFGALILGVVAAALTVTLAWWSIRAVQGWLGHAVQDDYYQGALYFMGFVALVIAVVTAIYQWLQRKIRLENLMAGGLMCGLVLLVASSLFVPGGSYLLLWPMLFSLAALFFLCVTKVQPVITMRRFAVLSLWAIPAIVLLVPMIQQIFVAVGLNQAGIPAAMLALLCGLLIPHLAIIGSSTKWLTPGIAALAGAVLIAAAIFMSGFDGRHPQSDNIFYVLNADTGKAAWASTDMGRDTWTAQYLPVGARRGSLNEYLPTTTKEYLSSPAPVVPLSSSHIELLDDSTGNGVRTLRMKIGSAHAGMRITASAGSEARVLAAVVNGKRVESDGVSASGPPPGVWGLEYWAAGDGGIELTLEVGPARPLKLQVIEQEYGLPEIPGTSLRLRPANLMPAPFSNSDTTLISKSYLF